MVKIGKKRIPFILIAIMALAVFSLAQQGLINLPEISPSAIFTSISQADFVSNDPELNGDAWIVTARAVNIGNEKAIFSLDKGYLDTVDLTKTTSDFKAEVYKTKDFCEADADLEDSFIYGFKEIFSDKTGFLGSVKSSCLINDKRIFIDKSFLFGLFDGGDCWEQVPFYKLGRFDNVLRRAEVRVDVFRNNVLEDSEIVTQSDRIKRFNDRYGNFIGLATMTSLGAGEGVCSFSSIQPVFDFSNNSYYAVSSNYVNDVKNASQDLKNTLDKYPAGFSFAPNIGFFVLPEIQFELNNAYTYNSKVDQALIDYTNFIQRISSYRDERINFVGSTAKFDPVAEITSPELVFHLKGDFLGIEKLVGEPKIDCVGFSGGKAGEKGYIKVNLSNVGSVQDQFSVFASCPSINYTSLTKSVTLNAKDSLSEFLIPVSNNVAVDKSNVSCEAKMISSSGKSVSCNQVIDLEAPSTLTPLDCGRRVGLSNAGLWQVKSGDCYCPLSDPVEAQRIKETLSSNQKLDYGKCAIVSKDGGDIKPCSEQILGSHEDSFGNCVCPDGFSIGINESGKTACVPKETICEPPLVFDPVSEECKETGLVIPPLALIGIAFVGGLVLIFFLTRPTGKKLRKRVRK